MLAFSVQSLATNLAILAVLLLFVGLIVAKPWLIASWSQMRIRKHLNHLHKQGAHIIENICLRNRKGEVIHIEYLIIGNEITCLNTSARSGKILGSLRSPMWSQENEQGSHRFKNPMRQHDKISNTLQGMIGSRLPIQVLTIFTHASLHTTEANNIITLKELDQRLSTNKAQQTQFNSQQLLHLIQNISVDAQVPESNYDGNPSMLKTAHILLTSSVTAMTIAIAFLSYGMI